MRLLHYSDLEGVYDYPGRAGRLAGRIDARRDESTLVVGTGDDLGPGVLAMAEDGRQALDFFDVVRPDVETFGNHDFDYGLDATREIVRESPQEWVSANVRDDGDPFGDAVSTTIVERGGESVGFVGVTDPASSVPDELAVGDSVEAVRAGVADLRDAGADWTVALAHVRDERLTELTASTDVDAVLAGHVHRERRDRVEGTLVVRPGANGRVLWEVELGEGVEATRLTVDDAPLDEGDGSVPLDESDGSAPLDERVAQRLRDRIAEAGLAEVVGRVEDPVVRERERCFAEERRVTNFIVDAYRWAGDADVGYVDTRMLRGGPPLSGEVTVADLVGLAPFGADLCVAEIRGADLRRLAEAAVATDERTARSPTAEAWWAHFSGMTVVWDRSGGVVREVRVGGDPLDPGETYSLATNGYVLGTDEFPAVSREDVTDTWGVQYDAFVEYAREVGVEAEVDGRIVVES